MSIPTKTPTPALTMSRTYTTAVYVAHPLPAGYTEEGLIETGTSRLVGEAGADQFQIDRDDKTGRPRTALVADELGTLDHHGTFTVTGAAAAPMRRLVMQARATRVQAPGSSPESAGSRAEALDHAGTDGAVGGLVDQDEAAGGAGAAVLVGQQRLGDAQPDASDVVEAELAR